MFTEPNRSSASSMVMKWSSVTSVCRLSVCPASDLETGAKFRRLYRKSGSPSENTTSDFAPEVAKYNFGSVRANRFAACWCSVTLRVVGSFGRTLTARRSPTTTVSTCRKSSLKTSPCVLTYVPSLTNFLLPTLTI